MIKNNQGKCVICGNQTVRTIHHGGPYGPFKKTCSEECKKANFKINIEKMKIGINKNKDSIYKDRSERMFKNNPMRKTETIKKLKDTFREKGIRPKIRGGNGQVMPVPQRTLLAALGGGWFAEQPVKTEKKEVYPTCYKIDVANPFLKLGIEIDGGSHNSLERKAQDKKKTDFLNTLGWTILRFKNEEVMSNLEKVLKQIHDKSI